MKGVSLGCTEVSKSCVKTTYLIRCSSMSLYALASTVLFQNAKYHSRPPVTLYQILQISIKQFLAALSI